MTFHGVFDTQKTFRLLTDCSAFPGKTAELGETAERITLDLPFSRGIALLCLTLLDGEVSFFASGEKERRRISELTYSRPVPLEEALYAIGDEESLPSLIEGACRGTLPDPHRGATIIAPVRSLERNRGERYLLAGPGIETEKEIRVESDADWLTPLLRANREFPLGVELYLLDRGEKLMVLPRTTRIKRRA